MGVILAFDTATPATTVALTRDDADAIEARHDPAPGERPGHQRVLLALVEQVLAEGEATWDDLDTIAVGVGPGTFTGLRIGIATARALSQASGIPLTAVSTLESLARGAQDARPVLAVLDARRGEAFAAAWMGGEPLVPASVVTPDELARLAAALPATPLAVGDGAVRFAERLEAIGADVPPGDAAVHRVSAGWHCRIAARSPVAGPNDVLPEYLRAPDAEMTRPERAR